MDHHLPNEDVEIPMPLNTTYPTPHLHPHGHGHGQLFDHDDDDDHGFDQNQVGLTSKKQQVKYKECLKNHAASMGGNARDGCGEFMPSGEEGTIEALTCSACNCHRNFHRKEVEGERGRMVISHKGNEVFGPCGPRAFPIMPFNMGPLQARSDQSYDLLPPPPLPPPHHQYHHHHHSHHHNQGLKKRFRTKFTQEQKEKMTSFAEKVGWKIQKQEESVVQQFCQEIGVKRRVLKVWMHNNKHNLAKKSSTPPIDG